MNNLMDKNDIQVILKRIEEKLLEADNLNIEALEIEVKNLKEQVSKLQSKIETLEHSITSPH